MAAVPVGAAVSLAGVDCILMLMAFFLSGSLATKYSAKKLQLKKESQANPEDNDAKTGRNSMQVLATGGIPAALCLLPFAGLKLHWKLCYLAYLACCCGDTLASEFGQLSSQRPLLILDFSPVSRGRDGGVTLRGTVASLLGGLLIGACGGTLHSLYLGGLYGVIGSALDSVLGAVIQHPDRIWRKNWKLWNIVVNALSSILTVLVALLHSRWPFVESFLLFGALLIFIRVAELPRHMDRASVELLTAGFFFAHLADDTAGAGVSVAVGAFCLLLQDRFGWASATTAAAVVLAYVSTAAQQLLAPDWRLPASLQPRISWTCALAPALVARPVATMIHDGVRRWCRRHRARLANREGSDALAAETKGDLALRWLASRTTFLALYWLISSDTVWLACPAHWGTAALLMVVDGLAPPSITELVLVMVTLVMERFLTR